MNLDTLILNKSEAYLNSLAELKNPIKELANEILNKFYQEFKFDDIDIVQKATKTAINKLGNTYPIDILDFVIKEILSVYNLATKTFEAVCLANNDELKKGRIMIDFKNKYYWAEPLKTYGSPNGIWYWGVPKIGDQVKVTAYNNVAYFTYLKEKCNENDD